MLVLGIETATLIGSVGIVETAGRRPTGEPGANSAFSAAEVRAEVTLDACLQHGAALLPAIDDCLARAGLDLDAFDAIAVSVGPGSFTGLRVGLATAKGLVIGGGPALVGVSTLAALALTSKPAGAGQTLVFPCLDARRGEVYGAAFLIGRPPGADPAEIDRLLPDGAYAPAEFAEAAALLGRRTPAAARFLFLGDGAERYASVLGPSFGERARFVPVAEGPPSGAAVAILGAHEIARRGADDPRSLAPTYVRASQAERARAARAAGSENAGSVAER